MLIPTIDLVTLSDIWSTTIQDRLVYHTSHKMDELMLCIVCLAVIVSYDIDRFINMASIQTGPPA